MTAPRAASLSMASEIASLWKLAWPVLVGQLANVGMAVADVAMTGHVNAEELAAVSLGASVWTIVIVTVMGTMMAINTVVAIEVGAARLEGIAHSVRQAMWKGLGVGLVACAAVNLATLVFGHLGLSQEVAGKAAMFLHVSSLGMPAFACYRALYGYTTSLNQTKPVMMIALLGLACVVAGNWLLVFGKLGLPRMGAVGCAVSTAVGTWVMFLAMLWWVSHSPVYRETYPFRRWEWPNGAEIGRMLRLGLPIGVTYFAEVSAFGLVSLLLAPFGVVQVSSNQIALNFSSLTFMVPLSFGIALISRVGQAVGEGNPERARFVAWTGVRMAIAFGLVSALFMAVFRWQIARAYTSDAAVQALTAHLLLLAAVFQLSDCAQVAASSAIRGYAVTRTPMLIQLLAFWGMALPLGFVLGTAPDWLPFAPDEPWKASGYWTGLILGLTVAALLLCVSLRRLAAARVCHPQAFTTPPQETH